MTESKKAPTGTAAKRGKIRGTAQVTSKEDLAPLEKPGEGPEEEKLAYEAGQLASKRGTPSRPPLGYSNAEVKAWYAGYKAHANPQTGGPVEGIEGGYRRDY